jgi:hypothetical protein
MKSKVQSSRRERWASAAVVLASLLAAGAASADFMAGWDFSDLPASGASLPTPLSANYRAPMSDGEIHVLSGTVLAASLPPGTPRGERPGIGAGVDDPAFAGHSSSFNDFPRRRAAGQVHTEYLALTARDAATVEIEVAGPGTPLQWTLSMGGFAVPRPATGAADGESTVDVSFGDDCGSLSSVGSITLAEAEARASIDLGLSASTRPCVHLDLDGSHDQPLIDNLTIAVPEPSAHALGVCGALLLLALGRRRERHDGPSPHGSSERTPREGRTQR